MKRALSGWEFLTDIRDNRESSLFLDEAGLNILSDPPDNLADFFASENKSYETKIINLSLFSPKISSPFLVVSTESFLLSEVFCSDGRSGRSEVSECSALVSGVGLTVCPALTVVPQNLSDSSIFSAGHLLLEVFSACPSSVLSVFILLSSFIILVMSYVLSFNCRLLLFFSGTFSLTMESNLEAKLATV